RFQIITKMPYPDLGDPWIAARRARDPRWYAVETAKALMQTYGRSCRHAEDHGVTYVLDTQFERFLQHNRPLLPEWFLDAAHAARPWSPAPPEAAAVFGRFARRSSRPNGVTTQNRCVRSVSVWHCACLHVGPIDVRTSASGGPDDDGGSAHDRRSSARLGRVRMVRRSLDQRHRAARAGGRCVRHRQRLSAGGSGLL